MTATVDTPPLQPTPSPLRVEPTEAFDAVGRFLRDVPYSEEAVCRRLDIASIDRFRAIRDGRPDSPPADALDLLIRLFLDNESRRWDELAVHIPEDILEAMRTLGLVRPHREDSARAVANVLMYPTESLHIVSDAIEIADGSGGRWWDLVYAAITTNTRTFLGTMPRSRCEATLDLCTGTGVAALAAASSFSDHAWAIDVAERSTAFARFNARLNRIPNVTVLAGDLYEPVRGMTFDRIVAHPPYVPSRETRMVYRDGGSDGEGITRRIIEGLPEYLRPGGTFHCVCTATDRRDAPLEERLREMLGEAANEFDIAIVVTSELDPTEYYVRLAVGGRCTWQEAEEWHHHFAALGIVKMVYATIAIMRHTLTHAPYTVRRRIGAATGDAELSRLLRAAEVSASPEALNRLLDSRPLLCDHVSLHSEHALEDGGWAMTKCVLTTAVPFDVTLPCPTPMVSLIGQLNGTRTVREIYEEVARQTTLAEGASIERLASYIHVLAAHGLVELRGQVTI